MTSIISPEEHHPHAALVVAAIVTYHPDLKLLSEVVNAAAVQTTYVVIIANDGAPWSCPLPATVTILKQSKNLGLGGAYNVATRWARDRGATHLLLLDQDSVPTPGMVTKLVTAFTSFSRTAAVGGLWRDSRTGQKGSFLRRSAWGTYRYTPRSGEIVPVDFLISSGSLIGLDAVANIGSFDEALFIDYVDTDWTLRARAKDYQLYGVADARLDHQFGEATWRIPLLRRQLFQYSPERNYYRLRNSIALCQRPYVPWRWALRAVFGTIALTVFCLACAPSRLERLRLIFHAARDGLRMGPYVGRPTL